MSLMSTSPPGDAPIADRAHLRALVGCATLLCAAVVAFDLLYLYVPKGKWPVHGFAPDIGAAYARALVLPDIVITPGAFAKISVGLQGAMYAAFFTMLVLLRGLADGAAERTAYRIVIVAAAVASVALILTPPSLSNDLYRHAVFGRMIITRGFNPYVTPGNALAGDPILALADGRGIPTHYGPLFTDLSVLAAAVGGGGPIRTALAFKVMATAFGALTAWAVVELARQNGRSGLLPLALVALNPLVLLETAASAHNEPIMIGLALAGLAVAGKGKPDVGFALLVGSMHVKWVTATLVGLVAIARLREVHGWRPRSRELAKLLAISVGITVALYLPFWTGRAATGGVRRVLAEGAVPVSHYILFGAIVLVASAVVVRSGHRHLLEMSALTNLGFLLLSFGWLLPWYLIPPIALLSVRPMGRLNLTLFSLTTIVSMWLMANWAVLVPS